MSDNTVEGLMAKIGAVISAEINQATLYDICQSQEKAGLLQDTKDSWAKLRTALESLTAAQAPASPPGVSIELLSRWFNSLPGESLGKEHFDELLRLAASPSTPGVDAAKPQMVFPREMQEGISGDEEYSDGYKDGYNQAIKDARALNTSVAAKPLRWLTDAEVEACAEIALNDVQGNFAKEVQKAAFTVNALPLPGAAGDGKEGV